MDKLPLRQNVWRSRFDILVPTNTYLLALAFQIEGSFVPTGKGGTTQPIRIRKTATLEALF
jgi:hypothetical protein